MGCCAPVQAPRAGIPVTRFPKLVRFWHFRMAGSALYRFGGHGGALMISPGGESQAASAHPTNIFEPGASCCGGVDSKRSSSARDLYLLHRGATCPLLLKPPLHRIHVPVFDNEILAPGHARPILLPYPLWWQPNRVQGLSGFHGQGINDRKVMPCSRTHDLHV